MIQNNCLTIKSPKPKKKDFNNSKKQPETESKFPALMTRERSINSLLYLNDNSSTPQTFPTSKLVSEDIECGTGLAFKHWDSAEKEENEKWLDKYTDRTGVKKWIPRDRKSFDMNRINSWRNARYRSNFCCEGLNLNLGNHYSSASAAAAIDLANILCWGSEDCKPLNVLSSIEASVALRASGVTGIFPGGRVEPLRVKFFTESVKNSFLKSIDGAHASIGGQDDLLSSIICSLDAETARNALASDKLEEQERQRELKLKRRAEAAKERRLRRKEKEKSSMQPIAINDMLEKDPNVLQFQHQYGIFEVDNDGKLKWVQENDLNKDAPSNCMNDVAGIKREISNAAYSIHSGKSTVPIKKSANDEKPPKADFSHPLNKNINNSMKYDRSFEEDKSRKQMLKPKNNFYPKKKMPITNPSESTQKCMITHYFQTKSNTMVPKE